MTVRDNNNNTPSQYILTLIKPYLWPLFMLGIASVFLSLLQGVSQVTLTPLLEIVLNSEESISQALTQTQGFTFDLNQLGLSILTFAAQVTGYTEPWNLLLVTSGVYLVLSLISQLTGFWVRYWGQKMRLDVSRDLEYELFGHILRLPLSFLQDQQVGWLQSRMVGDVQMVMTMLNQLVIDGLSGLLLSIFYIVLLLRTDARLTIIAGAAGLAQLGLSRGLSQMAKSRTSANFEIMAQTSAFRQERLSALREIKSLAAEKYEQDLLYERVFEAVRVGLRYYLFKYIEKPIRTGVNRVVVVVVMLFGAWQLLNGQITVAAFLLFMFFAQSLIAPLTKLSAVFLQIVEIRALLEGVAYVLEQPQEIQGDQPAEGLKKSVEIKDVSFSYGNMPVLQHINLSINKGEMVALVGRSGAGKSTLVDLILRFYLPTEGNIELDGENIQKYNLQAYRRLFGIVSQDATLFNDTVFQNIAYARPELTIEQVKQAAQIANAESFILSDLPDGYDTVLGERGVRLSGGQRQRIAIARAVAHQPDILILDEATSSLDSESEHLVQEAIEKVVKGSTAIVIAHRLATILMADKIIVLKDGKIIETGTHQELLKKNGEYRYLYDLQFKNEDRI